MAWGRVFSLHGEAGEIDHEQIDEIRKELGSYDLENNYYWHETGLHFKLIPHSTLWHEMKQEDENKSTES